MSAQSAMVLSSPGTAVRGYLASRLTKCDSAYRRAALRPSSESIWANWCRTTPDARSARLGHPAHSSPAVMNTLS